MLPLLVCEIKTQLLSMLYTCCVPVTLLCVCVCSFVVCLVNSHVRECTNVNTQIPTFLTARACKGTQELFDQNSSKYYNRVRVSLQHNISNHSGIEQ